MRRVFGFVVVLALVMGVVGSAAAENGTVDPFSTRVKKREGGAVDPFGGIRTMENGSMDPFEPKPR